jgi:hypothetical protein
MAGLVPSIHVFECVMLQDVDARHKAGYDGRMSAAIRITNKPHSPGIAFHSLVNASRLAIRRSRSGIRAYLRNNCQEQKSCEHDEVYDALQNRGPAGTQSDHAEKQGQRQQDLILGAQAEFERLGNHDR